MNLPTFPGWTVWRSKRDDNSPGEFYASRRGRTLHASTPEGLAEKVADQERKDAARGRR